MGHEQIALWTDMSSDPELIAGVRAGDTSAFGLLYERHADAARKVAAQYTNSPSDVDDVVAESFSRVLRALQQGDGPDLAFRAYLFTIVRRTGMDLINKGIRTKPRDDMTPFEAAFGFGAASDEPALEGFEQSLVADAFKSLPERWQAVLWYTEVEKKSPKDIAPLLGLSANGVAALSYRAREALRQAYLQKHLSTANDVNCLEVNTQLGAYVRGGLNRREATRVDEHLGGCDKCAALVAELQDVNRGMRAIIAPLVLGVLGVGALQGGLPIGGVIAGAAAASGGVGVAGGAGAGAGAGGAGAGVSGGVGGAGAGTGVGSGVGAGTSAGVGVSGSVGVTAGAGATGFGTVAGVASVGTAALATTGAASASLATNASAAPAGSVVGSAAAPGTGVWGVGVSGTGATGAGSSAAGTSAAAGSTLSGTAASGSAVSGSAVSGSATSGAVAAGAGTATGATTGGVGAAASTSVLATGGVLAGAGGVLIPAAAVVAVASVAFAGAGYLGVFDSGPGSSQQAISTPAPTVLADPPAPADSGQPDQPTGTHPDSDAEHGTTPDTDTSLPAVPDRTAPDSKSSGPNTSGPNTSNSGRPGSSSGTPGSPAEHATPGTTPGSGNSGDVTPGGATSGDTGNPGDTGTPGGGNPGDASDGTDGASDGSGGGTPTPRSPHLTLAKAPLDYLEISQSNPSVGMSIGNSGEGAAEDVTAHITLPAGLAFAPANGGELGLMSAPIGRVGTFTALQTPSGISVGDWNCTLPAVDSTATCELDALEAGSSTSFDLPLTITGTVPDGAVTTFSVTTGDQTVEYSVLTGVDTNDEDVDVVFTGEGQLAVAHVGAPLMGCDTTQAACRDIMGSTASNTGGQFNNNGWTMLPLNEAGGEHNSATTTLTLPEGSVVTYASVEWAANRHNRDVFTGPINQARLRGPGQSSYVPITADTVSQTTDAGGRVYYQARADVTDIVKQYGPGDWSLADIALSATANDPTPTYYGGFTLTVIYGNPALHDSRVAIFDGAHWVTSGAKADFTFSTSADAKVTLGWTAWEGDRALVGDRVDIDGDTYAPMRWTGTTAVVGDSGNAADSTAFGGRWANTLGVDAKLFRPGNVRAGVHKITVDTSGDNFLLSTLTVTIEYP